MAKQRRNNPRQFGNNPQTTLNNEKQRETTP
jgi:hypothetical protein